MVTVYGAQPPVLDQFIATRPFSGSKPVTVNVTLVRVGHGVVVTVGVLVGVNVIVGVAVIVGVEVSVGVKVTVGVAV